MSPERARQLVNASNLTYWEALWRTAKQSNSIMVLRRHGSPVDIVADAGLTWIKVSTISEKRLLMEMAKQGWEWAGHSDDDGDEDDCVKLEDDEMDISIVKMALTLSKLAKETRIKYKKPHVHFVLTRIRSGNKDIDAVLDRIRATGATVQTADKVHDPPPIEDVLENLVVDERKYFSSTLNVDCTILLAIVSDISHGQVKEAPWFNRNIRRQILIEEKEHLMVNSLWPAMVGRTLVCTKFAAQRMREIVDMIGTDTEKARTRIFMGDDISKSPKQLSGDFQHLSSYSVPEEWKLPIKIVDDHGPGLTPPSALTAAVAKELTDINQSVFIYGWRAGLTTITSNRVAVKAIEKTVEGNRTSDDDVGPDAWVCPTARSLVAKEKDRRDGYDGESE